MCLAIIQTRGLWGGATNFNAGVNNMEALTEGQKVARNWMGLQKVTLLFPALIPVNCGLGSPLN